MYVKRRLGIGDLMPVVRIVGKVGVSDFKKCFSREELNRIILEKMKKPEEAEKPEDTENMIEQIGFDVVLNAVDVLLVNIPKCEKELYDFLSSMCGVSVEEFLNFPPSAFVDVLQEIFTAEEAKDFFSHVSRLLNLGKSDSGTSYTEDTPVQASC